MIAGGIIFLGLTLVYFILNNMAGVIKSPKGIGITLLTTSITYLVIASLIPPKVSLKGKPILIILLLCILLTALFYLIINNTVVFSVLAILTWLIGGGILLFRIFSRPTVD
jgi:hypothetical protein